ncbi:MAG: HmuY family protein [Agriterribacter sp.]
MMKLTLTKALFLFSALFMLTTSCRKKDAPLPDNLAQFESTEQGMDAATTSVTVKIKLSRATDRDIPITIGLTNSGVEYTTHYTTVPAATSNTLALTVLSGSSEASFTVNKAGGALFYGDEKIDFKINSTGSPVIIGTNAQFTLSFAELIATASSVVGDGGGATYGNKIFFDLSANTQVPVQRTKWDFGFYTGSDDFRVILNSSVGMMAKQIDKNDLNAVTAADTTGFSTDVIFNQNDPQTSALAYIDYPSGDLTKTAIASVSATATDNKVYIINRGKGIGSPAPDRGWKKIRVIRNASGGYTLQHADIAATTFSTVDIAKDDAYFFKYISVENGAVDVEPKKEKWDIAWTYFSNVTNFGSGEIPYLFQDIILQNRNVEAVKVMTATKTYEAFAEADISSLTFSTTQTTIGSDWRSGGGQVLHPLFVLIGFML